MEPKEVAFCNMEWRIGNFVAVRLQGLFKEVDGMADFFAEFRGDHRWVMQTLLEVQRALEQRQWERALELVEALDRATGPHMEFEEKHLYPEFVPLVGQERVQEMLNDHGGAAQILQRVKGRLRQGALSDEEVAALKGDLQRFLRHAADCEGSALLAEALPPERIEELGRLLVSLRATGRPLTVYRGVAAAQD